MAGIGGFMIEKKKTAVLVSSISIFVILIFVGIAVAEISIDKLVGESHLDADTKASILSTTGDMNNDGSITDDDVSLLAKHYYFGDSVFGNPDIDNSGSVNFYDVILLARSIPLEVSSNVAIDNIEGRRGGTNASASDPDTFSSELYRLDIRASLKVGSEPVDMNQVIITITDGTTTNDLRYIDGNLVAHTANTKNVGNGDATYNSTAKDSIIGAIGYPSTVYAIHVSEAIAGTYTKFANKYPDVNADDDYSKSNHSDILWSAPDNTGHAIAKDANSFRNTYTSNKDFFARGDLFYTIEEIRDEDRSFTKSNPVMNRGDLVKISILTAPSNTADNEGIYSTSSGTVDAEFNNNHPYVGEAGLTISPRSTISINIVPAGGANTQIDFVAPSSFGVRTNVGLYP